MRVVHYINQFFAGVGGEEEASVEPFGEEGAIGPGRLLDRKLGEDASVVATVACGDSYFAEHPEEALGTILELIRGHEPDLVVLGPAFNAGRYGVACATVACALQKEGVPSVTGLYPENPALDTVDRVHLHAVPTAATATGMAEALDRMVTLGRRVARGDQLGLPDEEGYLPRGVRRNVHVERTAAERAVEQLLKKVAGEPFATEIPLPVYDRVPPSLLTTALEEAVIALVTEASVVPYGNPDHLESARATHWFTYPLGKLDDLREGEYMTVHGGFDNAPVNADPDRALPLDVVRELVAEGQIGALHDHYYVTTGMATAIQEAERIGREIAQHLLEQKVHAVLVTST